MKPFHPDLKHDHGIIHRVQTTHRQQNAIAVTWCGMVPGYFEKMLIWNFLKKTKKKGKQGKIIIIQCAAGLQVEMPC